MTGGRDGNEGGIVKSATVRVRNERGWIASVVILTILLLGLVLVATITAPLYCAVSPKQSDSLVCSVLQEMTHDAERQGARDHE